MRAAPGIFIKVDPRTTYYISRLHCAPWPSTDLAKRPSAVVIGVTSPFHQQPDPAGSEAVGGEIAWLQHLAVVQ